MPLTPVNEFEHLYGAAVHAAGAAMPALKAKVLEASNFVERPLVHAAWPMIEKASPHAVTMALDSGIAYLKTLTMPVLLAHLNTLLAGHPALVNRELTVEYTGE